MVLPKPPSHNPVPEKYSPWVINNRWFPTLWISITKCGSSEVTMIKKIFLWIVCSLAALIILRFGLALIFQPPLYVYRAVVWGDSAITDYKKFPSRAIQNTPPVFQFADNPSPDLFTMIEYQADGVTTTADFEKLLAETGTTAFIVIRGDSIIYENYFNGFHRDSYFTSFSIAKSFLSALVGIAIDEGYIGNVDDPVILYVPELGGRGLDDLTIHQLLTMSSGIRYRESEALDWLFSMSDDTLAYSYPELRSLALDFRFGDEPVGMYFHYNDYNPILEGLVLERATGMPVSVYLQEKIWKPLGMEYPATWSLDSNASGFEKMATGLNARAIDYARFGRLYMNLGNWNGRQIIPEQWVIDSTTPDPNDTRPWINFTDFPNQGGYYKYHWWGYRRENHLYDYIAWGHLQQLIYIRPDENLIFVRLGSEEGPEVDWGQLLKGLADRLSDY
jgi:CubicO group peptidase (beta-lactamase class C family)